MNTAITTRLLAAAPLLALAGALLTGCGSSAPKAPPGPSAACQHATAAQNAYVAWVTVNTAYPEDSVSEGSAIQQHDLALLKAMTTAGCPATTPIQILPGS